MWGEIKIGDGTAPVGFPAYRRHEEGIQCTFNGCDHIGWNTVPAGMLCKGIYCECPCCRMLAGKTEYGCNYGR